MGQKRPVRFFMENAARYANSTIGILSFAAVGWFPGLKPHLEVLDGCSLVWCWFRWL
jgi:hypothetical protein